MTATPVRPTSVRGARARRSADAQGARESCRSQDHGPRGDHEQAPDQQRAEQLRHARGRQPAVVRSRPAARARATDPCASSSMSVLPDLSGGAVVEGSRCRAVFRGPGMGRSDRCRGLSRREPRGGLGSGQQGPPLRGGGGAPSLCAQHGSTRALRMDQGRRAAEPPHLGVRPRAVREPGVGLDVGGVVELGAAVDDGHEVGVGPPQPAAGVVVVAHHGARGRRRQLAVQPGREALRLGRPGSRQPPARPEAHEHRRDEYADLEAADGLPDERDAALERPGEHRHEHRGGERHGPAVAHEEVGGQHEDPHLGPGRRVSHRPQEHEEDGHRPDGEERGHPDGRWLPLLDERGDAAHLERGGQHPRPDRGQRGGAHAGQGDGPRACHDRPRGSLQRETDRGDHPEGRGEEPEPVAAGPEPGEWDQPPVRPVVAVGGQPPGRGDHGEGQREGLRAGAERHRRADEGQERHARRDEDRGLAPSHDVARHEGQGGEGRDQPRHRGQASQAVDPRHEDLAQPLVPDPLVARERAPRIAPDEHRVAAQLVAGPQVPPGVRVVDGVQRADAGDEDDERERDEANPQGARPGPSEPRTLLVLDAPHDRHPSTTHSV